MSSESKVYKKRPHRKVKSGCATCKRRKIKCDEEKPQCSNCVRYSADCVYPSPPSSDYIRDQASTSTSNTPPLVQTPESLVEEPPVPQCPPGSHDLPLRDLSLLHQWTISTCYGFGDNFPGDAEPWQVDVPKLGQQFSFLMRGILAVSALHLARLSTDHTVKMRYIQLAAYHQDLALPEYRNAITNVSEKNVHAILAFSALTTVYSFAAPKDAGSLFADGAPEWVFLHRGVGDIPPSWQGWIDNGPMDQQMHRRRVQPVEYTLNPEDYRLVGLHGFLTNLPAEEQIEGVHYDNALHWLRQAFALTYSPESRIGPKYGVLFWVEKVDQGYLELLGLQRPRALILLAHCCVLLKRASGFWYLDGFAEHVLKEMKPCLADEFLPWIEWPLQACGLS
ncbi:uncharacterized protein BDR25DRAFT_119863 [Lindgomyces ingoldianus]|uniref:Uncharacterized protein n=1 Tax=Lindgomyces ingoldianus TaxID=673940 RepID=A0ACB6R5S0_9PLEO|nr:uncharacterized protein BDR25DRAFT_119863 [Lindgomyces ingoldianus]KAF2474188.1 hypothetical protein BDR25DRAFT_119863 [Lindgomyces ingoldianus]